MTGLNGHQSYQHSSAPAWKYEVGDWILNPIWGGLIDHHMRITDRLADTNGQRRYQIFDTALARGTADYEFALADTLERSSRLGPATGFISCFVNPVARCPVSRAEIFDSRTARLRKPATMDSLRLGAIPLVPSGVGLIAVVVGSVAIASRHPTPRRAHRRKAYRRR